MEAEGCVLPKIGPILPLTIALLMGCAGSTASAQPTTVFIDDSVTGAETLAKLPELIGAGNLAEAARVAQLLLETDGDRLVASGADPDVYISVRTRVMRELLRNRELLRQYREAQEPRAAKLLADGKHHDVERTRLLTASGFEAGLRTAQEHFERARFCDAARVLTQLAEHPEADQRGPAVRAASLARALASYSAAIDVKDAQRVWSRVTLEGAGPDPVAVPPRALEIARDPTDPAGAMDRASLIAPPLSLGAIARWAEDSTGNGGATAQAWTLPSVSGEIMVTNDGVEVAAWDRWTLVNLWRFSPSSGDAGTSGPLGPSQTIEQFAKIIEQPTTVGIGQGVVVASTGFANTGAMRSGDGVLHALSLAGGAHLWSVDVSLLDRNLADGVVRGRPVVESDTVVAPVSRTSQGRRVGSSLLVGLDASTGAMRWIRPVASIGIGSYRPAVRPADSPVAQDGVVYHADALGIVMAIEAGTGRPLWARRLVPASEQGSPFGFSEPGRRYAWATSNPIVVGEDVLMLEPGTGDLLRLRRRDGAVVARRLASDLNGARYLVRVGDAVAGVGISVITMLPLSDIQTGRTTIGPRLTDLDPAGRVVGAGNSLVIPVKQGLVVQDVAAESKAQFIPLKLSGQVLVADGQVVVAGATELHGYHKWSAVEPRLRAFIKSRPLDPGPALTFIDVATRAGQASAIPEVADRLLSLLDSDPGDAVLASARRRLYEQLVGVVAQARGGGAVTLADADTLVERLGRAADSPVQHAQQRLIHAWVHESLDRPAQAVESLQAVLAEPELAGALVPPMPGEGDPMRPAGDVATRRLLSLLSARGYGPYEPFAEQAQQEWASMGDDPGEARASELARRYPLARVTPSIWLSLGRRALRLGDPSAAIDAFGQSADSSSRLAHVLKQPETPELAEASGELIAALSGAGRLGPLTRYIATLTRDFPAVAPRQGSAPIDLAAARSAAAAGLTQLHRRPNVGAQIAGSVQTIAGWTIVRPRIASGKGVATDQIPMASLLSKQVGVWAVSATDGSLAPLWTRDFEREETRPTFLQLWWDRALLSRPGLAGPSLELVTLDGRTAWRTPELETLLPPEPPEPDGALIETPIDGSVSRAGLLAVVSDRVAMLARRNGRAAAFDLTTGKSLWAQPLPMANVYDARAVGGKVVIVGLVADATAGARVLLLDEITGRLTAALGGPDSPVRFNARPRWVRGVGGLAVVGFDDSIIAVDPSNGQVRWTLTGANAAGAIEAWPVNATADDDRLVIHGSNDVLWLIHVGDVDAQPVALPGADKLGDATRRRAADIPVNTLFAIGDAVGLASARGLIVFNAAGMGIGRDIMPDRDDKLVALGDHVAAFLDSTPVAKPEAGDAASHAYLLRLLSLPGAAMTAERSVILYDQPSELAVLDGKVAISAGPVTLVIDSTSK